MLTANERIVAQSRGKVTASLMTPYDAGVRQAVRLAKTHYENFTVLSLLLPRALRHDVATLYAYCRHVDDLGDEAAGSRPLLLAQWEGDLRRCWQGSPEHPLLVALQKTIRRHNLPPEPFLHLIEANRRDQACVRYNTWEELLEYCALSANPVGRLYLHLLGYADSQRQELADATCTALQLANFWQDVALDAGKGRIYIPAAELQRFNVSQEDVLRGRDTEASAALIKHLCDHAAAYFAQGLGLLPLLPFRHAYNVRLFSAGGFAILRAVERRRHTALSRRPHLRRSDKWRLALCALDPRKNAAVLRWKFDEYS